MARPKTLRSIENVPEVTWFKPAGVRMRTLDEVSLTLDEIEAVRLADLEGAYQEQIAQKMNVSRQTVGRILVSAHRKIADALVNGKAIRFEGGVVRKNRIYAADHIKPKDAGIGSDKKKPSNRDYQDRAGKIAVTAEEPHLDSKVDLRFGRSAYLLIIDVRNNDCTVIDNRSSDRESGGKGILTADRVLEAAVSVVITGNMGHGVLSKLAGAGIGLYQVENCTVREAVDLYRKEVFEQDESGGG